MSLTQKLILIITVLSFVLIGTVVTCLAIVKLSFDEVKEAKQEEILAKIADNRMLRSKTNFRLPGFTSTHLERVTRNADMVGIPWWIPAGIGKIENGGDTLEVGMIYIPEEIRKKSKVLEWQYAALMRMLNQQAWRVILSDPELLPKVIIPFAQIYKAEDPQYWLQQTTNQMIDFRNIEDKMLIGDEAKKAIVPKSQRIKHIPGKYFRKKFRVFPKLKHQGEKK